MKSKKVRQSRQRFAVLGILRATSPWRQVTVICCLVAASLAEGVGVASLFPLFAVMAGDSGGGDSVVSQLVLRVLGTIGLSLQVETLLVTFIVGMWLRAGLTLFAMRHVAYQVAEVSTKLRLSLIAALFNVRWSYFAHQPVGRFANSISSEASRAASAYHAVMQMMTATFRATVYLTLTVMLSWQLALISFAIGGVVVVSLSKLVRAARRAGRKQTRLTRTLVTGLSDALVGIKPLKAMARHVQLGALFAKDISRLRIALRRQALSRQATNSLQDPIMATFMVAWIYVAYNQVPLAELLIMGGLLFRSSQAIGRIQQLYQEVALSESAYWSMYDTIKEAQAEREVITGKGVPSLARACAFDAVSFAYGNKSVLEEISLQIPAGKVTTITGTSGAGKTTLADLLLGLYRPSNGEIWLDDMPLSEVDLLRWRRMVGYVPQEVILFHDSIVANVTLGDPELSRDDAIAALGAAGAWEFVSQLPDGLDSIVGERGGLLSGGQRQRIAVARALVHKPSLLILDEATSALDPETESAICTNLRQLSEASGLTILAITHQPAWVTVADRVFELRRHRAIEMTDKLPRILASQAAGRSSSAGQRV